MDLEFNGRPTSFLVKLHSVSTENPVWIKPIHYTKQKTNQNNYTKNTLVTYSKVA